MIEIGTTVPDIVFQRADGSPCSLSSFAGRKLLLIFLRHLA
jgi:peroxiredoxin